MPPESDEPLWVRRGNPFPDSALANVSGIRGPFPTIETDAVSSVRERVETYLRATARRRTDAGPRQPAGLAAGTGSAFVIVGDFGTGKTHLAMEVLARIEHSPLPGARESRRVYIAAPGASFLSFHREFMRSRLSRSDLIDRVRELYAEVLVDSLRASSALPSYFTEQISSRDIDPVLAVERLGLAANVVLDALYDRLRTMIADDAYGTFSRALSLLMRSAYEEAVWHWLCGGVPDPTLVEYGIEQPIDSDELAMEAFSVIALLYGDRGQRFVLVLDEMERLLSAGHWPTPERLQAFKRMIEAFRKAGALLVCCGLPETLTLLPAETGRVEPPIIPSALTVRDVLWYVEQAQRRADGGASLEPFDQASVEYLVRISGGVAREVIRLCYQAYDEAAKTHSLVTREMLADVARNAYPKWGSAAVREETVALLKDEGYEPVVDTYIDDTTHVDVWVPLDGEGAGCAVVIAEALLRPDEIDACVLLGTSIRSREPHREALLVVSGFLSREYVTRLTEAFSAGPLLYKWRSFRSAFIDAFRETNRGPIVPRSAEDPASLGALRELMFRIERLSRQQSQSNNALRSVTDTLDSLGAVAEGRLKDMESRLQDIVQRDDTRSRGRGHTRRLPAPLQSPFDDVKVRLSAFGDIDAFCATALGLEPDDAEPNHFALVSGLRDEARYFSIGVAQLLTALVDAFHEAVLKWLDAARQSRQAPQRLQSSDSEGDLRRVCRTFENICRSVPLLRLDDLSELSGKAQHPVPYRSTAVRRGELQAALDRLADDVLDEALRLAVR